MDSPSPGSTPPSSVSSPPSVALERPETPSSPPITAGAGVTPDGQTRSLPPASSSASVSLDSSRCLMVGEIKRRKPGRSLLTSQYSTKYVVLTAASIHQYNISTSASLFTRKPKLSNVESSIPLSTILAFHTSPSPIQQSEHDQANMPPGWFSVELYSGKIEEFLAQDAADRDKWLSALEKALVNWRSRPHSVGRSAIDLVHPLFNERKYRDQEFEIGPVVKALRRAQTAQGPSSVPPPPQSGLTPLVARFIEQYSLSFSFTVSEASTSLFESGKIQPQAILMGSAQLPPSSSGSSESSISLSISSDSSGSSQSSKAAIPSSLLSSSSMDALSLPLSTPESFADSDMDFSFSGRGRSPAVAAAPLEDLTRSPATSHSSFSPNSQGSGHGSSTPPFHSSPPPLVSAVSMNNISNLRSIGPKRSILRASTFSVLPGMQNPGLLKPTRIEPNAADSASAGSSHSKRISLNGSLLHSSGVNVPGRVEFASLAPLDENGIPDSTAATEPVVYQELSRTEAIAPQILHQDILAELSHLRSSSSLPWLSKNKIGFRTMLGINGKLGSTAEWDQRIAELTGKDLKHIIDQRGWCEAANSEWDKRNGIAIPNIEHKAKVEAAVTQPAEEEKLPEIVFSIPTLPPRPKQQMKRPSGIVPFQPRPLGPDGQPLPLPESGSIIGTLPLPTIPMSDGSLSLPNTLPPPPPPPVARNSRNSKKSSLSARRSSIDLSESRSSAIRAAAAAKLPVQASDDLSVVMEVAGSERETPHSPRSPAFSDLDNPTPGSASVIAAGSPIDPSNPDLALASASAAASSLNDVPISDLLDQPLRIQFCHTRESGGKANANPVAILEFSLDQVISAPNGEFTVPKFQIQWVKPNRIGSLAPSASNLPVDLPVYHAFTLMFHDRRCIPVSNRPIFTHRSYIVKPDFTGNAPIREKEVEGQKEKSAKTGTGAAEATPPPLIAQPSLSSFSAAASPFAGPDIVAHEMLVQSPWTYSIPTLLLQEYLSELASKRSELRGIIHDLLSRLNQTQVRNTHESALLRRQVRLMEQLQQVECGPENEVENPEFHHSLYWQQLLKVYQNNAQVEKDFLFPGGSAADCGPSAVKGLILDRFGFKPSSKKDSGPMMFLPTNLHFHTFECTSVTKRMRSAPSGREEAPAVSGSETETAPIDVVSASLTPLPADCTSAGSSMGFTALTCGAFAHHKWGLKDGGMRKLAEQILEARKKLENWSFEQDPTLESVRSFLAIHAATVERQLIVLSQALTTALSGFLQQTVLDLMFRPPSAPDHQAEAELRWSRLVHCGFLFQVQSLLSTWGSEEFMLGDMAHAMKLLEFVQFQFVRRENNQSNDGAAQSAPSVLEAPSFHFVPGTLSSHPLLTALIPHNPTPVASAGPAGATTDIAAKPPPTRARSVLHVNSSALCDEFQDILDHSLVSPRFPTPFSSVLSPGSQSSNIQRPHWFTFVIALNQTQYDRLPAPLREVNSTASSPAPSAPALPVKISSFGPRIAIIPVLVNQGVNEMQTLAQKMGSTNLQQEINHRALHILSDYSKQFMRYSVEFSKAKTARAQAQAGASSSGSAPVSAAISIDFASITNPLLWLQERLSINSNLKDLDLVNQFTYLVQSLGGSRMVCCKSAKDRTSMEVTLEQAHFLRDKFQLSLNEFYYTLQLTRLEGVRRLNVIKNTGNAAYAFNAIQRSFLPALFRPPDAACSSSVES